MTLRRTVSFTLRCGLLFGFWLLLLEPEQPAAGAVDLDWAIDWAVGGGAAVLAALLSLRLLPPSAAVPRPDALLRFLWRFLFQSMGASLDVARRAFDPRLPVRPGLLRQPTALPEGGVRALFGAVTSQVPGTLAIGSVDQDTLLYHCLDRSQDAGAALAKDEASFAKVLGVATSDRQR
jgi:multicomponent Na+:H+ antiporter subunit E